MSDGVTVETPDGPVVHETAARFHVDESGCLHVVGFGATDLATYAPGSWHKAVHVDPKVRQLTEQINQGKSNAYTREWYCGVPPEGVTFRVTDATWTPDHKIQRVYEIALGQGRERR